MKQLIIDSEALAEFDEAVDYYEAQAEGSGQDLSAEIGRAFERRAHEPAALSLYHHRTRVHKCLVTRFPYVIFFLELPDSIWVAAVAHSSRRPGYWRRRTPPG